MRPALLVILPLVCALGLVTLPAGGQDKAGPGQGKPAAPEEAEARALYSGRWSFQPFVFTGETFPALTTDVPGKPASKVTFRDRDGRATTEAKAPGVYGAVIEVTPRLNRPTRRYVTLYRLARPVDPAWRFAPDRAAELAAILGIDRAVVAAQAEAVAEVLGQRPAGEWVNDARAARFFAGLSLSGPGSDFRRKWDDAFAHERQWWVTQRRQLTGLDKVYPDKFAGPTQIKGPAAPELRAGTEAEAGMKPGTAEKIDAALRKWAADDDQAFAVCVARNGVIVLHRAYGARDGRPMTVDAKSWMASITKTMSATLLMMLVDRGLVDLDAPVANVLPGFRGRKMATPLTPRHLYTHTDGLGLWPGLQEEMPDLEERVADAAPYLPVGKQWAYAGTNYMLGGKIIEDVSGEAIPQFYRRHLLGPLGCDHTDVTGTQADAFSTPLDMAKLGQMLLNGGVYGKFRFFQEETFERMLPDRLTQILGPDARRSFGIGLDGTRAKFGHGAASAATFSIDRADGLVVVMTRNRLGKNQDRYNGTFWQAIRDGIDRPAGPR